MTAGRAAALPSDQLEPVVRAARRALRFWWVAVLTFAVVAGLAVGAIRFWPRQYRSDASLQYREGMQWSSDDVGSARRVGQRLREMALSRAQLANVIVELGLYPELVREGRSAEAVEEMRLATAFRFDQSDVFVVSFTGDSPEQAQKVTARLVDMLIAENRRQRSEQADVALEFLDAEKRRKGEDLAAKEAEQLRFLTRHPEFAQELTTGIGATLRARQARAQETAAPADGGAGRAVPPAPSPQDAALLAARNAAEARLTTALRELADRRARLTEQHPDTRVAAANAAEAEYAYRRAVEALAAAQPGAPRGAPSAATRPEALAARGLPAPGRTVAVETEWARLSREVNEARERLQQLDNQQFRAAMTASMLTSGQTAQIVVIDPPFLPARPVGVRTKVLYALALAAALVLALAAAVALGILDDLVYDRADLDRLQIVPVLAEITTRGMPPPAGSGTRRKGGNELGGNDLGHPISLPRAPQLSAIAPPRVPSLPAPPEAAVAAHSGEIVVARAPSTALRLHMVERGEEGQPQDTTYFSFVNDFEADQGEDAPRPHQPVFVRVYRPVPTRPLDGRAVMLTAPDSAAASSFRVLRHRLAEHGDLKTILVTSPHAGEGKTLAAVNLALALGEGGRARVLLVEANFRAPAVARLLGFQPPIDLAEQLGIHRERPAEPWHVVEIRSPSLHVLAATPGAPPAPLDGRALAICIEELRQAGYDHVVVDSTAVLESADVNLIEDAVDGIVVSMWARRSHVRAFRRAAEQVERGKLRGVVLLGS